MENNWLESFCVKTIFTLFVFVNPSLGILTFTVILASASHSLLLLLRTRIVGVFIIAFIQSSSKTGCWSSQQFNHLAFSTHAIVLCPDCCALFQQLWNTRGRWVFELIFLVVFRLLFFTIFLVFCLVSFVFVLLILILVNWILVKLLYANIMSFNCFLGWLLWLLFWLIFLGICLQSVFCHIVNFF